MKRAFFFLLISLLSLTEAIAQQENHWTVNANNWSNETPIYCNLVDEGNQNLNQYLFDVAAFIGDEVRAVGEYNRDNYGIYFFFNVKGDDSDLGKEITFKAYNRETKVEYKLFAREQPLPITFTGNIATGNTPGIVSNLRHLYFTELASLSLPQTITIDKGSSIDLTDYLTITPEGAALPSNLTWDFGNSASYINVEGNTLTGLEATDANGVYLGVSAGTLSAYTNVIVRPNLGISIKDGFNPITVTLGAEEELTEKLTSCYTITPAGTTASVYYTVADESVVEPRMSHLSFNPKSIGTTTVTITARYPDGTDGPSIEVTVNVVSPIESISLSRETIDFNVGDEMKDILDGLVTILPATASNKGFTWAFNPQYYQSSAVSFGDNSISAAKEGTAHLTVTSTADPTKSANITVTVHDPVKELTLTQNTLYILYNGEQKSIGSNIKACTRFSPYGTASIDYDVLSVTSDNTEVVSVSDVYFFAPAYSKLPENTGLSLNAIAKKPGVANVTISFSYTDYRKLYTSTNTDDATVTISKTLKVVVVGMAIKEGYETITVKKNDSETLTQKLSEALVITPENSLIPTWSIEDESIVTALTDAVGYNPIAVGSTTMTATLTVTDPIPAGTLIGPNGTVGSTGSTPTSSSISVTLTVNVTAGVRSITINPNEISCLVGDNLNDVLAAITTVLPEEATNKAITWSISGQSTNPDALQISQSTGAIQAVKTGTAILQATSVDNPQVTQLLTVNVYNYYKDVSFAANPLNIDYTGESKDISQELINNITFLPQEASNGLFKSYIQVTSSATDVVSVSNVAYGDATSTQATGLTLNATAKKAGEAVITVKFFYPDYLKQLTNPEASYEIAVTKTFTISVNSIDFSIEATDLNFGEEGKITVTKTGSASFDENKMKIVIAGQNFSSDKWDQTITEGDRNSNYVEYTVKPIVPGPVTIEVWYNDQLITSSEADVAMPFNLKNGWQWRTLNYGDIAANNMQTALGGNKLVEVRAQYQLMYNDPAYGYFGELATNGLEQGVCYKIRTNNATDTYRLTDGSLMLKGSSWILNKGWTWVPNPYLYRRSLTRLDTEDFAAGDRIVSKNSGFAEFNGTTWEGDLTMLNPGEGYLFYTNGAQRGVHLDTEFNWDAEDDDASESGNNAKQMGGMGNMVPWHYDASQWRDNMSIIADGSGMNGCIIGAFVGDECRGIGRIINGKFFITIHGQGSETVNFRLYDGISSDTYTITESMPFSSKAGTLKNPVKLTIANGTTGINSITTNESNGNEIFGTNGVRRQTIQRGVNIIRKADGTVKKVMK